MANVEQMVRVTAPRGQRPKRLLRASLVVALLGCIFVADTLTDYEIAVAVFYIAVILVGIGLLPRRGVIALACVCIGLTLLSFGLTHNGSPQTGVLNAAISISAIGLTTYVALRLVDAIDAAHESRAQLTRVARLMTMAELTGSIAHELNQPLAAIVTSGNACLRWLSADPPNTDRARASVQRSIADAERASEIISRLRGLARGAAPQKELTSLDDVINAALDLARAEIERQGIALRVDLGSDVHVLGDPIQLQQVVANLVLNSIEAMAVVPADNRELVVTSCREEGTVVVAVADSGPGLTSEVVEHMYDAFWSKKREGLGMGLTISRSIVEAHEGRLWAEPRPSGGTVFRISFPAGGGHGD